MTHKRWYTRRDALRATGGALVALGGTGTVSAQAESTTVRVNVGYTNTSGRRAARSRASARMLSGAAGQLMAAGDTNTQARDQLVSTAEDVGLAANESGNGLLDVAAALGLDSSDDL